MSSSSFAAAQQRILERQAKRQLDAQRQVAAFNEQVHDSALSRLPRPLNLTASPLTSLWNTLLDGNGTRPAYRVGQVDAELLDEELLTMLRGQIGEGLKYFGPHLQDDWSREIQLALRAILFKLSVWDNDASYGASLQNLRFADARQDLALQAKPSKWQKAMYGIVTVLGRYGWERWESWLVDQEATPSHSPSHSETIQQLSHLTHWLSTTHSIAAFVSFLVFLVNGRYRTLVDRVFGLRLVSPSNQISREVSFEYLNRQLVWHAFTEFLLFLLPLVGIGRWRRWLSRAWKKTKTMMQQSPDSRPEDGEPGVSVQKSGPLAFLSERTCAICYQDQNPNTTSERELMTLGANSGAGAGGGGGIVGSATTDIVNPYETVPCQCVYCFVCLATKIEAEEGHGWICLRCGETVYRCKPWSGDVVVVPVPDQGGDADGASSPRVITKSVGFTDQLPSVADSGPGPGPGPDSGPDSDFVDGDHTTIPIPVLQDNDHDHDYHQHQHQSQSQTTAGTLLSRSSDYVNDDEDDDSQWSLAGRPSEQ